jgi:DNA-binding SARP family transcriptional activator
LIEFGVLGPLEVLVDDDRVRLGPSLKVLALALFCAQGEAIPIARLSELIAEPGADPTGVATVRSHVSHLRRALRDDQRHGQSPKVLISGKAGGLATYALRTEAIDTDVSRFDQLVDEGHAELRDGRHDDAARVLGRALALWRGDPLIDAAGRSFARDWIEGLEGRCRQALMARAVADIGARRHVAVTGELDRLVRRWPDDEVLRALLAIALYRSGRVSAAATACRDAINAAQAQGLDTPRLHQLQRDILTGTLPETGVPHLRGDAAFHGPSIRFP